MGSAVAQHLARRGATVIGLDQYPVPHPHGSSHGETRNIRQAIYENPAYVPLLVRAFDLWHELEDVSGRELLRLTGRIMIGSPAGPSIRGALASGRQHQLPLEVLSPAEVRKRFPVLEPSDDMIGVLEHRAGMLFAEPCVEAQLEDARRHGGNIRFGERVVEWKAANGRVAVRTDQERYLADRLVVAVGGWLPSFWDGVPLTIERQVLLWFEPQASAADFGPDRLPLYFWELGSDLVIYGVPFWGDGVKVARHHGGEIGTMSTIRREIDDRDVDPVRAVLERHMPALAGRLIRGQTCVYTNTPDFHFIIDHHPADENVLLVSACSGHGFKYAPVVGEAVTQLLLDGQSKLDLSFFRVDRFRR